MCTPKPGETKEDFRQRISKLPYSESNFSQEDLRILKILGEAGFNIYQPRRNDQMLVGAITLKSRAPSSYRRFPCLPFVANIAASKRAKALNSIIEQRPDPTKVRYVVLHPFEPVEPNKLSDAIDRVMRETDAFRRAVARAEGRVLWTSVEVLYQPFRRTFHVHANLIVETSDYKNIAASADRRFGRNGWHDGGPVRKPQNLATYITKPPDLRGANKAAVIAYVHATAGRQLHRAAQNLQVAKSLHKLNPTRREVELTKPPELKDEEYSSCRASQRPEEAHVGSPVRRVRAPIENRILKDLGVRFLGERAEPVFLIQNFTLQPKTSAGKLNLELIRKRGREAAPAWEDSGGPSSVYCSHKVSANNSYIENGHNMGGSIRVHPNTPPSEPCLFDPPD